MTNETAYWEKQIAALHRTHEKQRRVGFIFLAMAVNLLLIFLAYLLGATYLATNDDTAIRSFASGSYSGEPSPYLVFVQYPLGFLLSGLYTWFPCVSWYGLFLLFSVWCLWMCCFINCYYAAKRSSIIF